MSPSQNWSEALEERKALITSRIAQLSLSFMSTMHWPLRPKRVKHSLLWWCFYLTHLWSQVSGWSLYLRFPVPEIFVFGTMKYEINLLSGWIWVIVLLWAEKWHGGNVSTTVFLGQWHQPTFLEQWWPSKKYFRDVAGTSAFYFKHMCIFRKAILI